MQSRTPSLSELKSNPALFSFSDYGDKVKLHARLTTLFPRATHKQEIARFFADAGINEGETSFDTCTYVILYNKANFIFDRKSDALLAIQIGDWPQFVAPTCNRAAPLTPEAMQNPHFLKMEQLESGEQTDAEGTTAPEATTP